MNSDDDCLEDDDSIHLRWIADGCETLVEVAATLRSYAAWLLDLDSEGWVLRFPLDNGQGLIYQKDDILVD